MFQTSANADWGQCLWEQCVSPYSSGREGRGAANISAVAEIRLFFVTQWEHFREKRSWWKRVGTGVDALCLFHWSRRYIIWTKGKFRLILDLPYVLLHSSKFFFSFPFSSWQTFEVRSKRWPQKRLLANPTTTDCDTVHCARNPNITSQLLCNTLTIKENASLDEFTLENS